ncbi:hypothetical protein D3C87_1329450 [compost metagenome]
MDLGGCLPQQEQATGNQDHVFPGKRVAENLDHRIGQLDDERDGAQQTQAQDQRHADTDAPCPLSIVQGQLVGQDRDEDQVIDAEHDLHHNQGGKGDPGGGAGGKL